MRSIINKSRIDYAFVLIAGANTVTTLSLEEMKDVICRALGGEFDSEVFKGQNVLLDVSISTTKDKLNET